MYITLECGCLLEGLLFCKDLLYCTFWPTVRPRWQLVGNLTCPYFFFIQSHVYAVGGNDGVASLSSVERYDPHLDKWIEVKEMGQRRAGNGVSELHGCLYVVGE